MCLNLPTRLFRKHKRIAEEKEARGKREHALPRVWDRQEVHSKCQLWALVGRVSQCTRAPRASAYINLHMAAHHKLPTVVQKKIGSVPLLWETNKQTNRYKTGKGQVLQFVSDLCDFWRVLLFISNCHHLCWYWNLTPFVKWMWLHSTWSITTEDQYLSLSSNLSY